LGISNFCCTFAPDDESQKRLVARHRVFFDANYSRTRRLEQSLIRNPESPQSPKLPLYKEILQFLPKLRKNKHKEGVRLVLLRKSVIFAPKFPNLSILC
jgi:hypothetical protein